MATEEQIEELAYSMWEQEGRPEGKDVEHYYRAKQKLEQREAGVTPVGEPLLIVSGPSKPVSSGRRPLGRKR